MTAQLKTKQEFRKSGPFFVSKQEADWSESSKILARNGLRMITLQEALEHSAELIKNFKGKAFYLSDRGVELDNLFSFDKLGNVIKPTEKDTLDQRIRIWKGDKPLFLSVSAEGLGFRRFALFGCLPDKTIASVVVGVKADQPLAVQPQEAAKAAIRTEDIVVKGEPC